MSKNRTKKQLEGLFNPGEVVYGVHKGASFYLHTVGKASLKEPMILITPEGENQGVACMVKGEDESEYYINSAFKDALELAGGALVGMVDEEGNFVNGYFKRQATLTEVRPTLTIHMGNLDCPEFTFIEMKAADPKNMNLAITFRQAAGFEATLEITTVQIPSGLEGGASVKFVATHPLGVFLSNPTVGERAYQVLGAIAETHGLTLPQLFNIEAAATALISNKVQEAVRPLFSQAIAGSILLAPDVIGKYLAARAEMAFDCKGNYYGDTLMRQFPLNLEAYLQDPAKVMAALLAMEPVRILLGDKVIVAKNASPIFDYPREIFDHLLHQGKFKPAANPVDSAEANEHRRLLLEAALEFKWNNVKVAAMPVRGRSVATLKVLMAEEDKLDPKPAFSNYGIYRPYKVAALMAISKDPKKMPYRALDDERKTVVRGYVVSMGLAGPSFFNVRAGRNIIPHLDKEVGAQVVTDVMNAWANNQGVWARLVDPKNAGKLARQVKTSEGTRAISLRRLKLDDKTKLALRDAGTGAFTMLAKAIIAANEAISTKEAQPMGALKQWVIQDTQHDHDPLEVRKFVADGMLATLHKAGVG